MFYLLSMEFHHQMLSDTWSIDQACPNAAHKAIIQCVTRPLSLFCEVIEGHQVEKPAELVCPENRLNRRDFCWSEIGHSESSSRITFNKVAQSKKDHCSAIRDKTRVKEYLKARFITYCASFMKHTKQSALK